MSSSEQKFCSSCFKFKPADIVKSVVSTNGKRKLLRCKTCDDARKEAQGNRKRGIFTSLTQEDKPLRRSA